MLLLRQDQIPYAKQKKDADAAWHLLVRQRIIGFVSTLPSQLSAEELNLLTSHKLAAVAVKLITVESRMALILLYP